MWARSDRGSAQHPHLTEQQLGNRGGLFGSYDLHSTMTRYTNAGRKRTYLEAGFNHDSETVEQPKDFSSSSTGSKEKHRRGGEKKRTKGTHPP